MNFDKISKQTDIFSCDSKPHPSLILKKKKEKLQNFSSIYLMQFLKNIKNIILLNHRKFQIHNL